MNHEVIDPELLRQYKLGHDRYEKLRKLNPSRFQELFLRALKEDRKFDELVDEL